MKLVCFSNNTAGGLLCDLLNRKTSKFSGYKISNLEHSAFKIGDTPTIQTQINLHAWQSRIDRYKNQSEWFGTHAHPSCIPDLSVFEEVISITTVTRKSKLYRWLRYYHGWFKNAHPDWQESDSLEQIDKIRELAKNMFEVFLPHDNCKNVEFEDIVEGKFVKEFDLDIEHFSNWKTNNTWLYNFKDADWAVQRFCEAEYEIATGVPFKYI